jgi:hypothetical protein
VAETGENHHCVVNDLGITRGDNSQSFHEQVADEIIRTVVKRRKGSLLDLDESELADICPDSATLNSRYGGRYRVQDILVRGAVAGGDRRKPSLCGK